MINLNPCLPQDYGLGIGRRKEVEESEYKTVDEFLEEETVTISEDVREEMREERGLIDKERVRRGQDWSCLSGQVVGKEYRLIRRGGF